MQQERNRAAAGREVRLIGEILPTFIRTLEAALHQRHADQREQRERSNPQAPEIGSVHETQGNKRREQQCEPQTQHEEHQLAEQASSRERRGDRWGAGDGRHEAPIIG